MPATSLTVDVYVAPMRPFAGAPAQTAGDEPMWSPMSSTLIAGEHDALLVDTLITDDQVDALADWVRGFGTRIVGESDTVEELVAAMLALHSDRDNPRVLWHSARAALAKERSR